MLTPIVLGFRNYKRSIGCENFVGATHIELMKNRPHYYLWGLAVEPAVKSQGIGSALMQPLLAQADAQKCQSISKPMMRKCSVLSETWF